MLTVYVCLAWEHAFGCSYLPFSILHTALLSLTFAIVCFFPLHLHVCLYKVSGFYVEIVKSLIYVLIITGTNAIESNRWGGAYICMCVLMCFSCIRAMQYYSIRMSQNTTRTRPTELSCDTGRTSKRIRVFTSVSCILAWNGDKQMEQASQKRKDVRQPNRI